MKYVVPKDYNGEWLKYSKNVNSANGEDGILFEILRRCGSMFDRWICEFGAWDGKYKSNTWELMSRHGYNGLLIESDKKKYKKLKKNVRKLKGNICTQNITIGYEPGCGVMLDDALSIADIPIIDFDVLSIDVDGPDYHIWKSLVRYNPMVVVIEHSGIDDYIVQRKGAVHKKDIDGSTSFHPMKELGESKGYVLLCDTGNMIFLDKKYEHIIH